MRSVLSTIPQLCLHFKKSERAQIHDLMVEVKVSEKVRTDQIQIQLPIRKNKNREEINNIEIKKTLLGINESNIDV